jgi:hypothetical protein
MFQAGGFSVSNPGIRPQPELADAEWDLILELLEAKRAELPSEIHHTSKPAYRHELESRLEMVEALIAKLKMYRMRSMPLP